MRIRPVSTIRRLVAALAVTAVLAGAASVPAGASRSSRATSPTVGFDISFPQCDRPLPSGVAFGIVGVNGGRTFTANPCLASQLRWALRAARPPAFYANTSNPGPAYTARWPVGQRSPRACRASAPNSSNCSFDYGWNAAKDSFATAVRAVQQVHGVSARNAQRRAANVTWWLDVEIMNSWQTLQRVYGQTAASKLNDATALIGAVRALWDSGITQVGIYSTRDQWTQITGGSSVTGNAFVANPVWLAGFTSTNKAATGCGARGFTGARVLFTQYLLYGFDANYRCG